MSSAKQKSVFSPESKNVPAMGYHVHENMVSMAGNRLVSLLRFKGASHDTRDKADLNREFKILNLFFMAIGKKEGSNLMLQTYTTKNRIRLTTKYQVDVPVVQDFVDAYTEPFRNGTFREVGYTIAIILKFRDLQDGISRMEKILIQAERMLEPYYGAARMGMEMNENGVLFSQIGRFFSLIFNGHEQDIICNDTQMSDAMINSETGFAAYDYIENRPNNGPTRFASTYDLRDFPESVPGMWDEVIESQFDFTLVQTFLYEERNKTKLKFNKQKSDLRSAEGDSEQLEELEIAKQDVTQGKKVFGRYHAGLIVYGDTPEQAVDNGSSMESLFSTFETVFVKSGSTNIYTWLTQYPAYMNVIYHTMKSTENLACGFSLHKTPTGKAFGNPPGDGTALMPMRTVNDGLFFLNYHDSPPGKNNVGDKLPGHKVNHAQTGAGKTTIEAAELIFWSRWNPMLFCLDYNRSLENVLRAIHTKYYQVKPGSNTQIQLFQLEDSEELRQALFQNIKICAGGEVCTESEEKEIAQHIEATLMHEPASDRSLSLMVQGIPERGGNCLRTRLAKWCRSVDGERGTNAWILDSPTNHFDPTSNRRLAFDITSILKEGYFERNKSEVEVLLNLLLFMKQLMQKQEPGALLLNMIAEYWAPISLPSTAEILMEILRAGRTRGELLMMDTQMPEAAINTEYGPTVVQQVITQQWMANENANKDSYATFGVTPREFEKIADLTPFSRELMVKQGKTGVMVKFDLSDLTYWIPLLSSDTKNLPVAERMRKQYGTDDPDVWLAPFLDEMVAMKVRQELGDDPKTWVPEFKRRMEKMGRKISLQLPELF